MGASRRDRLAGHPAATGLALLVPAACAALVLAQPAAGQAFADPVLSGRVLVGDTALTRGTVVLHHLSVASRGEVDSTAVRPDGTFELRLPNVPDPAREDVFFASVRHDGVLYFGVPLTQAVQLDSVYRIQTYDTIVAPAAGAALALDVRNVFFEPDAERWRVTDLFQLVNEGFRTVVAREGGVIWRYPLPAGAQDFELGHGEVAPDAIRFDGGAVVFTAPVPPGERMVLVRYWLAEPVGSIPTPGVTGRLDLLIREPAPLLSVEGLAFVERTELEPGTTYRHYSAVDLASAAIAITAGEERGPPPVEWAALLIALLLAGMGLAAIRGGAGGPPAVPAGASGRRELLVAVARLDEAFEANPGPSKAERAQYRRRRAELLARVRELG